MVVSICLGLSRLSLSTISAQSFQQSDADSSVSDGRYQNEIAAAYARYSSENQDKSSISQQLDAIEADAARNRHFIPPELRFKDEAISGRKRNRAGLNAMLDAARKGKFKVIYFWNISRLAREMVISLPIVKDLVYNHGIRIICTANGFDTNNPGWDTHVIIECLLSEQQLKRLTEDVRRGHRDNVQLKFSNGDYCFGYQTQLAHWI